MLGKMIRQEWKDTWKVCLLLTGAALAVTLLGCLAFLTPMWKGLANGNLSFQLVDVLGVFMLVGCVITLIGTAFGMFAYLGVRFYRSMYSERGYLTHTLPVSAGQLLLGKTLTAAIWYTVMQITVLACTLVLVVGLIYAVLRGFGAREGASIREVLDGCRQILDMIGFQIVDVTHILMQVMNAASAVILLFGAITLGQLSSRHRVLMSLVWYMGINVVMQVLATVLMVPLTAVMSRKMAAGDVGSVMAGMAPLELTSMGLVAAFAAGLMWVSWYIITRRLNLE